MRQVVVLMISLVMVVVAIPSGYHSVKRDDETVTTSIIDVLSANVEFSTFLRILQRKGLVPMLNMLENITLLLPINSAFSRVDEIPDNFDRYLINEVIDSSDYEAENSNSQLFVTLEGSPILFNWDSELSTWKFDNSELVEPDYYANSQNSMVQGIDLLLNPLTSSCNLLTSLKNFNTSLPSFSVFQDLFQAEGVCSLHNTTAIIPTNSALNFNSVELNYLLHHKKAKLDRANYLSNHFIAGLIGGNISLEVHDFSNNTIFITTDYDNNKVIDGITAVISDYLTTDGIVNFVPDDSFVMDKVVFTPRKYMYGLNLTGFVEELDFRSLSHLIDDLDVEQTVFVNVSDDDDDDDNSNDESSLNTQSSINIQSSVHMNNDLYQFAQGIVELDQNVLLNSKYCYKKIGNKCQKIKVSKTSKGTFLLNGHVEVDPSVNYRVGNTKIYLINDNLSPPARLDLSIGPYYHSSRSVKYLNDLGLINLPNNKEGYTILIPENDAWEALELTWEYLLKNSTALSVLMQSNIINGLVYSDFEGALDTTSIDGSLLKVENVDNGVLINSTFIPMPTNSDILFAQGVAHSIDRIVFPDNLEISLSNLLDSVNHRSFKTFLDHLNLDNLIGDENYSILIPTDSSLLRENITFDYANLEEMLRLHLIPSTSIQSLLNCESKIPTLLNKTDLSCREISAGIHLLQVLEGNDKEVRIINKGCTYSSTNEQQCVFIIDRPIDPEWIDKPFMGIPHIKLPLAAMGVGAILALILVMVVLSCFMVFFVGKDSNDEAGYEDVDNSDDEHRDLLLNQRNATNKHPSYDSIQNGHTHPNNNTTFSEQDYSDNAISKAIDVKKKSSHADLSANMSRAQEHKNFW